MKQFKIFASVIISIIMLAMLTSCSCKHESVIDPKVEATCTESGLTEGFHCNSCGEILTAQEIIAAKGHTEKTISGKKATCTEDGTTDKIICSVCDIVLEEQKTIQRLGHTTTEGKCTRCGQDFSIWAKSYYVDEFDMPTDDAYIYNKNFFIGTFSNSATTNSSLYAMIAADENDVSIFLYEYGRYQVKNNSSSYNDWYDITIRLADGRKVEYEAVIFAGTDRITFYEDDYRSIINILKSGDEISFYIVNKEYTTSTYLFKVNTSNFANLFPKYW